MHYAKQTHITRTPRRERDSDSIDQEVVSEQHEVRPSSASRNQQIIYTVYGVIAVLLLLRFIFALLGANPANALAHFIYAVTNPLVSPFRNLFGPVAASYKGSAFELYTLIAVSIYGLLAALIVRMITVDREASRHDTEV